jgi:hypothetical protein
MNDISPSSEQRRRVRRNAMLFGLVAVSFYLLFIVFAVTHGHK